MQKLSLFLISCCLMFAACAKEEAEASPQTILQEVITNNSSCVCDPFINQYYWRGKKVFVLAYRGPACNFIPSYYNAKGEALSGQEDYSYDAFLQESTLVKNIWSCKSDTDL